MAMTRKDFIELADRIKFHNSLPEVPGINDHFTPDQLYMLAAFCAFQNPNFDRAKWLDYINRKE